MNKRTFRRKMAKKVKKPEHRQQGRGVLCPDCGGLTKVVRTIPYPNLLMQERYRVCDDCQHKFVTQERIVDEGFNN